MTGWLLLIVGPLLGIGAARMMGLRRTIPVILGAILGQFLVIALQAQWQRFEVARLQAHPSRDHIVGFMRFQTSLHQRIGGWMFLAGIAVAVATVVLLLQRDGEAASA